MRVQAGHANAGRGESPVPEATLYKLQLCQHVVSLHVGTACARDLWVVRCTTRRLPAVGHSGNLFGLAEALQQLQVTDVVVTGGLGRFLVNGSGGHGLHVARQGQLPSSQHPLYAGLSSHCADLARHNVLRPQVARVEYGDGRCPQPAPQRTRALCPGPSPSRPPSSGGRRLPEQRSVSYHQKTGWHSRVISGMARALATYLAAPTDTARVSHCDGWDNDGLAAHILTSPVALENGCVASLHGSPGDRCKHYIGLSTCSYGLDKEGARQWYNRIGPGVSTPGPGALRARSLARWRRAPLGISADAELYPLPTSRAAPTVSHDEAARITQLQVVSQLQASLSSYDLFAKCVLIPIQSRPSTPSSSTVTVHQPFVIPVQP